jgi:hypothetical protein
MTLKVSVSAPLRFPNSRQALFSAPAFPLPLPTRLLFFFCDNCDPQHPRVLVDPVCFKLWVKIPRYQTTKPVSFKENKTRDGKHFSNRKTMKLFFALWRVANFGKL